MLDLVLPKLRDRHASVRAAALKLVEAMHAADEGDGPPLLSRQSTVGVQTLVHFGSGRLASDALGGLIALQPPGGACCLLRQLRVTESLEKYEALLDDHAEALFANQFPDLLVGAEESEDEDEDEDEW
mmetsp:Transcript_32025/g.87726  ORF Transcript_32025/g.87726 Transcript_32025/m.87726 type:complete len:128 (-) Transcript_32025:293-676(-)